MNVRKTTSVERLLRDKHSGCFLQSSGDWTDDRSAATHFSDFHSVLEACRRFQVHDVELVMRYRGYKEDVRMDLSGYFSKHPLHT